MKLKTLKGEIRIINPHRLIEFGKLNKQINFDAKYRTRKYLKCCKNQDDIKQKIKNRFPDIILKINITEEELKKGVEDKDD